MMKDIFSLMQGVGLGDINQVRVSGGGARSMLWRQILADVLGVELVTVNTTEGAAYGAALLAGVACGVWPDVAKASGARQSPGSSLSKSSPTSPTSKFENRTFVDALGNRVIQSELTIDRTRKRKDFQNALFPSVEVGLRGWQKAHSQGLITHSPESAEAIRYAPEEVNQVFQARGIERYIRELVEQLKPQGVRLWLTTATATHWGTLRLKEIQYRVDGFKDGEHVTLFETSIEIANTKVNPRVTIKGDPRSSSR